ncbi:MAG TPA: helix-turn-helix domain-containing protein [Verrucomicrobiae bacterium]
MSDKNVAEVTESIPDGRAALSAEPYIVKREVAKRCHKNERTIERWVREGIIPHIKLGKGRRATILFRWSQIQSSFEARFGVHGAARARGSR